MIKRLRIILIGLILATVTFSQTERVFIVVPSDSGHAAHSYPTDEVDSGDFERFPSAQLPEILDAETFLQFGNTTLGGYSAPFINGIPGYFNSVYFDGLHLFSPQLGPFDLKWLPLNFAQSVRVPTDGTALFSGPGAIGGIIDIDIEELPEKLDYTKLSGNLGDDGYRNYSGMFLKRFGKDFGLGVSASELRCEEIFADERDARNRQYSAISWGRLAGFDLRVFGHRFEGLNRSMNLAFSESLDVERQEDDHRIFDAKLRYGASFGDFAFRFNHQDYSRRMFFADEAGFERYKDNIDAVIADYSMLIYESTKLSFRGDYTVTTIDNENSESRSFGKIGGGISLDSRIGRTSGRLSLRMEKTGDDEIALIPGISLNSEITESYSIFAGGGAGKHPLAAEVFLDEHRGDFDGEDYYFGEAGIVYYHGDELNLLLKGFYSRFKEKNAYFLYREHPWASSADTLGEIYGMQARIEYTPDKLFLLGARYTWNSPEYSLRGLPEHFVQAYIEEKKLYGHDEISLTLRLEADGYLNLPCETPDVAVLRCRGNLKYLSVSIFGQFSYALVEGDGWHNDDYYLTELIPGKSWRIGAQWELFD